MTMNAHALPVTRMKPPSDAVCRSAGVLIALLTCPAIALGQAQTQTVWERAAWHLETSFTDILCSSLSLVAIVIGGLMFMFGEGGAKRHIAGIVFGGGLTLFAAQFLSWLF
jgi:type IV secretory pathway VirB2 component (pilin)